jgi:hypothetical protein
MQGLKNLLESSKESGLIDKVNTFQSQIQAYERIKKDLETTTLEN